MQPTLFNHLLKLQSPLKFPPHAFLSSPPFYKETVFPPYTSPCMHTSLYIPHLGPVFLCGGEKQTNYVGKRLF